MASARIFIFGNAFAAAASFVAAWLIAGYVPELIARIGVIFLGFVFLAHFTRRAEDARRDLRHRDAGDDS